MLSKPPRREARAAFCVMGKRGRLLRRFMGPKRLLRGRPGARVPAMGSFWGRVRQKGLFPLPAALLAFPTLTVLFATMGFLVGIPVTGWWGVLGFLGAAGLALVGGGTWRDGLKRVGWLVLATLVVFLVDQAFVLFSWWDAQAYHLMGSRLLLEGWNPVFDATRGTMLAATGADPAMFNSYHVAYLPRGGWVWGAVTAALTGNLESGDTLILLTAVVLGAVSWRVTPLLFGGGRWKRWFFASLSLLSPGVAASVFAFAQDGSLYALLMIYLFAACAYRKTGRTPWLVYIALAPILGCNLKFTGVVNLVLSGALFTVPLIWGAVRHGRTWMFWKWILANALGFVAALVAGVSPYLTNWVNHGGPFYPEQSFSQEFKEARAEQEAAWQAMLRGEARPAPREESQTVAPDASKDPQAWADWLDQEERKNPPQMTMDFKLVNADARAMGYFGRVVNAYFSKWLAHRYYEWKLGKKPFRPVYHLDQVDGLGRGFRIVMCLTLVMLLLTRRCGTPWLLGAILLTSFCIPTKMVGYVRYVPQLWMFPVLVAFNAMTVNVSRSSELGRTLVSSGQRLADRGYDWGTTCRCGGRFARWVLYPLTCAVTSVGWLWSLIGRSLAIVGRALGVSVTATLATGSYLFALGKLVLAIGMTNYVLSLVENMRMEESPRVYVLSLQNRYEVDGRCRAAWRLMPSDIPAPHVFDNYYRAILPASGVDNIDWQTPEEMERLRDPRFFLHADAFYLGENLWYWPRRPTLILHPSMHYYAGHPRRDYSAGNIWLIAKETVPDLPSYLWRVTRFRWGQFWANAKGEPYGR